MIAAAILLCWDREGARLLSHPEGDSGVWTVSSFRDFSRGALADGGANTYLTAWGGVRLIKLWDVNKDGYVDLVFPNTHDNNFQVDLFICRPSRGRACW